MKTVRKTFLTLFVTVFSVTFALLLTVLVSAACSNKITLRFETGDGTYVASIEGAAGSSYQKPKDPEKEGYFFDGWYADPSFTGESLTLPDFLPKESVTYYAKYLRCPVLTLDTEGGLLAETEHRIRPGTDLLGYLSDFVPQKEGLLFGGWELGGVLLSDGAEMTEEDMSLTARYKAGYEVDVFLQSADDPLTYEKSSELSYTGADWLGVTYTANMPALDHFLYDADRSSASAQLHAGENKFELRFSREKMKLHYFTQIPNGETREGTVDSRYGAHIPLEELSCPEGYTFFGWSDGEKEYAGGEIYTLETNAELKGGWGKLSQNLRGEGTLAVEVGEGEILRADYLLGGEKVTGQFFSETQTFVAGTHRGRLAIGGFLPDDSGRYLGSNLAKNATGEQFGVLTLDFDRGEATYLLAESEIGGDYVYDYDEGAGKYTGDYVFSSGALTFRFRLGENTFLRQGEEKNNYTVYDRSAGRFLSDTLALDGYGGGVWKKDEISLSGAYRGGARTGEWEFTPAEGAPFTVLLGERVWSDGADFAGENAFLYRDPTLAGRYESAQGALELDGYGLKAVYRSGEEEVFGPFTRTGNIISLQAETPLRFTLVGSGFAATGEESGVYSGEKGILTLDGAGGATLSRGSLVLARGSYTCGENDWSFEGEEGFRFRLDGDGYLLFDETKFGAFNAYYGPALFLDGYGGGKYLQRFSKEETFPIDVETLYCGGELIVLAAEGETLSFRRNGETIAEIPTLSSGVYPVLENGAVTGEELVLDGLSGAILRGESEKTGSYVQDGEEIVCDFGGGERFFRFGSAREAQGSLIARGVCGVFTDGKGTIDLDGYGTARYREENGEFSAPYLMYGSVAELERGGEVWRFTLSGESYSLARYSVYRAADGEGELLLQNGGNFAIYRAEKDYTGMYSGAQIFVSEQGEFSYRLYGDVFRVYQKERALTYAVAGGGRLEADGCGLGVYTLQDGTEYAGKVTLTDVGLVVFSSGELPVPSGMAGFRQSGGGTLEKLGSEFGLYAAEGEGGELFLQGDGVAYFRKNGVWRVGSYQAVEGNEFSFSLYGEGFRFRVQRTKKGSAYSVYSDVLAKYAGSYQTEEGLLVVDGYGARLGEREFTFVCGGQNGFIAYEEGAQSYFSVRFGEKTELHSANSRYCV